MDQILLPINLGYDEVIDLLIACNLARKSDAYTGDLSERLQVIQGRLEGILKHDQ